MTQGWISLHRKIMEHSFFQEKRKFSKFEAWIDLLLLANHKDNKFLLGNEMMQVQRGSFVTSKRKLSERWNWSRTKVDDFLSLLIDEEMIHIKSDTKKTLITVDNYGFYQNNDGEKEPPKSQQKATKKPQKSTNNNDNNENKKNTVHQDELFERWWELYNNKKGKAKCLPKFKQLLKKYSYETIMEGTEKYIRHRQELSRRNEFVPQQKNPLTFLNGEHFNDEYQIQLNDKKQEEGINYKPINLNFNKGED